MMPPLLAVRLAFVPPFDRPSVPPTVTAPVVDELGVSPVDPKLIDVTAKPEGSELDQDGADPVVPTRIWPVVPAAVVAIADVEKA